MKNGGDSIEMPIIKVKSKIVTPNFLKLPDDSHGNSLE